MLTAKEAREIYEKEQIVIENYKREEEAFELKQMKDSISNLIKEKAPNHLSLLIPLNDLSAENTLKIVEWLTKLEYKAVVDKECQRLTISWDKPIPKYNCTKCFDTGYISTSNPNKKKLCTCEAGFKALKEISESFEEVLKAEYLHMMKNPSPGYPLNHYLSPKVSPICFLGELNSQTNKKPVEKHDTELDKVLDTIMAELLGQTIDKTFKPLGPGWTSIGNSNFVPSICPKCKNIGYSKKETAYSITFTYCDCEAGKNIIKEKQKCKPYLINGKIVKCPVCGKGKLIARHQNNSVYDCACPCMILK